MNQNDKKSSENKNAASIRTQYSMEEIQNLLQSVDAVVSNYKAKQEGINPDDMIKTVRGGRVVWITKDEMNGILSKHRKFARGKKNQRAIRGKDSIASEINNRIHSCRLIVDTLRSIDPNSSKSFVITLKRLEAEQNQCTSLARDLSLFESAIQRKKQEDPIIQEVEQANKTMLEAAKNQDLSEVDVCQTFCERHMDEYTAKMQRLEPYIKKAKEYRILFLHAKQKIIHYSFVLLKDAHAILNDHMQEILYHDKSLQTAEMLANKIELLEEKLTEAEPVYQDLLRGLEDKTVKNNKAWGEFDQKFVQPIMKFSTKYALHYQHAWKQIQNGDERNSKMLPPEPEP